jgi:ribonuclease Z
MRLSQLGVDPAQLHGIFFTHMHTDHTEGVADLVALRWFYHGTGPKLDAVGSADVVSPRGFTVSCRQFLLHVADAFLHSGEVRVSAIRSTHMVGHVSYRVDTPVGSVVIGGDAGHDVLTPPRVSSTSAQVEQLAQGADILVHSTIHPIMGPDRGSGMFPYALYRQSTAADLGAMAQRAGATYLLLTHLIPAIGAERHGPWTIPGGPLTAADYRQAVEASGFTGHIIVGTDLASVRLPPK